ncbi:MAG: hypothetical protein QNJ31_02280 [Candidatus Caenarcaniphilales bacterium]|nr:hypothetical protein [Candidatus Caenarcaniphilales bacterium]
MPSRQETENKKAAAFANVKYRSWGLGLIPVGMLITMTVLFFKDLFSDLYVHTLGRLYKGDKSHLKTQADLQTLDRKYLLRTGLVDLPTLFLSSFSFLRYSMPISTLMIGGLWLFRNFVDNIILNKNNRAMLALNDAASVQQRTPTSPQQYPPPNPQYPPQTNPSSRGQPNNGLTQQPLPGGNGSAGNGDSDDGSGNGPAGGPVRANNIVSKGPPQPSIVLNIGSVGDDKKVIRNG